MSINRNIDENTNKRKASDTNLDPNNNSLNLIYPIETVASSSQAKHAKSGPCIDPENMTEQESLFVGGFLETNTNQNSTYFERSHIFTHEDKPFTFAYSLAARKCSSHATNYHYTIMDTTPIESGTSDDVSGDKGELNIVDHKAIFTKDTRHAIKSQFHKTQTLQGQTQTPQCPLPLNPLSRLAREFKFTPIHMHMKAPITFPVDGGTQSLLIMKLLDGCDLYDALKRERYSADERILLSMKLADALQNQVHNYGIIHRDIKDENIRYVKKLIRTPQGTERSKMFLTIFDYAFGKRIGEQDDYLMGTFGFIPPEVLRGGNSTEKCDIFGLAVILCKLFGTTVYDFELWKWGCTWEGYYPTYDTNTVTPEKKGERPYLLFKNKGLTPEEEDAIWALLKRALQDDPNNRPTTEEIYFFFNKLRVQRKINTLQLSNSNSNSTSNSNSPEFSEIKKDILRAEEAAIDLKKSLNTLAKTNLNMNKKNINTVDTSYLNLCMQLGILFLDFRLNSSLNKTDLKDTPYAIATFVDSLNCDFLDDIWDKATLRKQISSTIDLFKNQIHKLVILNGQVKGLNCITPALQTEQSNLLMKIDATFNKLNKYKITFDNICRLNAILEKKLKEIEHRRNALQTQLAATTNSTTSLVGVTSQPTLFSQQQTTRQPSNDVKLETTKDFSQKNI